MTDPKLTTDEIEKSSLKTLGFRWLASQDVVVIVLFCILGTIISGGYYGVTTAIPAHLKEIKDGYNEVVEKQTIHHKETVETIEKSRESERNLIRELMKIAPKGTVAGTGKPADMEAIP